MHSDLLKTHPDFETEAIAALVPTQTFESTTTTTETQISTWHYKMTYLAGCCPPPPNNDWLTVPWNAYRSVSNRKINIQHFMCLHRSGNSHESAWRGWLCALLHNVLSQRRRGIYSVCMYGSSCGCYPSQGLPLPRSAQSSVTVQLMPEWKRG